MRTLLALTLLSACTTSRDPEPIDGWFGEAGDPNEDVTEVVAFSDDPYDPADFDGGIGAMRGEGLFDGYSRNLSRRYAAGESLPSTNCGWSANSDELPRTFWAMVTLHPRYYYKNEGCQPVNGNDENFDSEEKYYGNFFIEDHTGGMFVLQDSKVAHFNMGDRVQIRVRGVGSRFDLDSIVSHDIVEVEKGPFPLSWTPNSTTTCSGIPSSFDSSNPADLANFANFEVECEFDDLSLLGKVVRVEGKVLNEPDTFGGFFVEDDNGDIVQVSLDSELNRRKWRFPVGGRVKVTGPTLNAFGHSIVIMRVGQVELLDD